MVEGFFTEIKVNNVCGKWSKTQSNQAKRDNNVNLAAAEDCPFLIASNASQLDTVLVY